MVAKCKNCRRVKGPGHNCDGPPPMPQFVRANAVGPPPPKHQLDRRFTEFGDHLPVGQPQVLPPGGIFNPGRFRRNKSTKKSLRKSKPKKSTSKKPNRRM